MADFGQKPGAPGIDQFWKAGGEAPAEDEADKALVEALGKDWEAIPIGRDADKHWDAAVEGKDVSGAEQSQTTKVNDALKILFGPDWSQSEDVIFLKSVDEMATMMKTWDQSMSAVDMAEKIKEMAREALAAKDQ